MRNASAESFSLMTPIQVLRHQQGSGSDLNEVNEFIVRGCLLTSKDDQESNDLDIARRLLQRVLDARTVQHRKAEQLKKLSPSEETSKVVTDEFIDATKKAEYERERLLQVFFHLRAVRGYMKDTKAKIDQLNQGDVSEGVQGHIKDLQNTMLYLESLMHAVYDFDRTRSSWVGLGSLYSYLEHSTVQARRLELTGNSAAPGEFAISQDLVTKYPAFAAVLRKLLYKQDSPQLLGALESKRVFFGDKPQPATAQGTQGSGGWNLGSWLPWGGGAPTTDLVAAAITTVREETPFQVVTVTVEEPKKAIEGNTNGAAPTVVQPGTGSDTVRGTDGQ